MCIGQVWVRHLLRLCALLSLVSVSLNTPRTFDEWPALQLITFIVDVFVTFMFTAEMVAKMHIRGLVSVSATAVAPSLVSGNGTASGIWEWDRLWNLGVGPLWTLEVGLDWTLEVGLDWTLGV